MIVLYVHILYFFFNFLYLIFLWKRNFTFEFEHYQTDLLPQSWCINCLVVGAKKKKKRKLLAIFETSSLGKSQMCTHYTMKFLQSKLMMFLFSLCYRKLIFTAYIKSNDVWDPRHVISSSWLLRGSNHLYVLSLGSNILLNEGIVILKASYILNL